MIMYTMTAMFCGGLDLHKCFPSKWFIFFLIYYEGKKNEYIIIYRYWVFKHVYNFHFNVEFTLILRI